MADPSNEVANPGTETYADKVEYDMDEVHNLSALKVTPYLGSTTTTSFSANSMNEYTSVGGTTHTYDANGNLTDDGTYEYSYDFHNHLVKVVDKGTSSTVAEYDYDCLGRGRRIKKVVGSDTTRFVYHDQHVIEELDGSDNLLRLFAYAAGWDNPVMMEAADVADVDADLNTTEMKRFYYHTQLLGSITQVTDEDEVVVESYEYDAYGNTTIYDINASSVSSSQIENPYMYTARRMDEETGLYHYRARAYSPTLRRFIQRDPLEYVDGPNAFAYAGARPSRSTDPTGQQQVPVDLGRANATVYKRVKLIKYKKESVGIEHVVENYRSSGTKEEWDDVWYEIFESGLYEEEWDIPHGSSRWDRTIHDRDGNNAGSWPEMKAYEEFMGSYSAMSDNELAAYARTLSKESNRRNSEESAASRRAIETLLAARSEISVAAQKKLGGILGVAFTALGAMPVPHAKAAGITGGAMLGAAEVLSDEEPGGARVDAAIEALIDGAAAAAAASRAKRASDLAHEAFVARHGEGSAPKRVSSKPFGPITVSRVEMLRVHAVRVWIIDWGNSCGVGRDPVLDRWTGGGGRNR